MVNGVTFGPTPGGGFSSIDQANAILTGQGGISSHGGGGDMLELSTHQQKKNSKMSLLVKGALVGAAAFLALKLPFVRNLPGIRNLLTKAPKAAA